MDRKGKNKISADDSSKPKRARPSSSTGTEAPSVAEGEHFFAEFWSQLEPVLSHKVRVEVETAFQTYVLPLLPSLREKKETGGEAINEPVIEKFKLVFYNQPASTIFTNNEIKAENGEALVVAICDATTGAIVCTGVLSRAKIGFFLLDGDYEKTLNILSPRYGKRPLLLGNDVEFNLKDGVGSVESMCITDNSSWMKSKKFRMGVNIIDEKIIAMFPNIGFAVSQPFRVMDHRGEVNKKHHPPSKEDELYRLEGIGKDGAYHKNLLSHGIKNVGDFLNVYQLRGPDFLKKLLGDKVPKKMWMMMVKNAFECLSYPMCEPLSQACFPANEVVGDEAFNEDVVEQHNLGDGYDENPQMYLHGYGLGSEYSSLLFMREALISYEAAAAAAAAATTMQALTPNTVAAAAAATTMQPLTLNTVAAAAAAATTMQALTPNTVAAAVAAATTRQALTPNTDAAAAAATTTQALTPNTVNDL